MLADDAHGAATLSWNNARMVRIGRAGCKGEMTAPPSRRGWDLRQTSGRHVPACPANPPARATHPISQAHPAQGRWLSIALMPGAPDANSTASPIGGMARGGGFPHR
jgi:hypothetical protein